MKPTFPFACLGLLLCWSASSPEIRAAASPSTVIGAGGTENRHTQHPADRRVSRRPHRGSRLRPADGHMGNPLGPRRGIVAL